MGGMIRVEMVKAVSQSYLTSLWNQDALRKDKGESLDTLTNRYSRRFTKIVIGIAVGAAVFWAFREPAFSLPSFTSVLIVACPCALALAAPFALGTAQRVLGRRNVFLKCPGVIEDLARVETIVFDKTGTLTTTGRRVGAFEELWAAKQWLSLTRPRPSHAVRIGEARATTPGRCNPSLRRRAAGWKATCQGTDRMGSEACSDRVAFPQLVVRRVWIGGRVRTCPSGETALKPTSCSEPSPGRRSPNAPLGPARIGRRAGTNAPTRFTGRGKKPSRQDGFRLAKVAAPIGRDRQRLRGD